MTSSNHLFEKSQFASSSFCCYTPDKSIPFVNITHQLQALLEQAVQTATGQSELIVLENPRHEGFGDYATPIAMQLAKKLGQNPREIAQQIMENIPDNTIIEKAEIAGPGFLNITLAPEIVSESLREFAAEKPLVPVRKKRIEVEFASPNVAKPLHFGHFRGLILGESLARLLRHSGHEVLTDNFVGDWGTQFGKLIVAIRKWGDKKTIDHNPIEELVRLYRKFHQEAEHDAELEKQGAEEFRKMEVEHDAENLELWKWIVGESLKDFFVVTDRLDAHFDEMRGESFYEKMLPTVLEKLRTSGIGSTGEAGALVVEFGDESKLPTMIFQKSDGATLYQTRDLAKIIFYDSEGFDEMIYVVGNEQNLHFRQVFETARRLGYQGAWTHAGHGLVRLPEGKMSARAGTVISLSEVFDEAYKRAFASLIEHNSEIIGKEREDLAEILAIGALKFNDLGQNRKTDILFDWEAMLDFNGYSGPFIQYSAVRCASILRKATDHCPPVKGESKGVLSFEHEAELSLAKKILRFSDVVLEAAERLEPHVLAEYLFQLAGEYNSFYAKCPVLKADEPERTTRLFLTQKTAETLTHGLYLLGIKTPKQM